jgi:hypothetical protein
MPRTEDARLGRLESLGFSRAAQFGFVRGAEERSVCGFGWVIRRSGMRGRDGGKRDRGARVGDVWCLRKGNQLTGQTAFFFGSAARIPLL